MNLYNVKCCITITVGAQTSQSAKDLVRKLLLINNGLPIHPLHSDLGLDDFKFDVSYVNPHNYIREIPSTWLDCPALFNDEDRNDVCASDVVKEARVNEIITQANNKLFKLGIKDQYLKLFSGDKDDCKENC